MLPTKEILILGGGTAGWMTANLLHKKWKKYSTKITLVESPTIGIIGVGEGSTPKLKDFFDELEIKESEWMPACNATYKTGISFQRWSTIKGYESYFHPFGCTIDSLTNKLFVTNTLLRRKGIDVNAHPDQFFLMAQLAKRNLAPIAPDNFPFQFDYAYHFDSTLLGQFLMNKAIASGVNHVQGTVKDVNLNHDGEIANIRLDDERILAADFFVDCSGFSSVLLQQTLKVPFHSFKDNLFNDAAVAIPSEITQPISPQTVSEAMSNGWSWKIPLTNRFGNGYVYSSDFCTSEDAEVELRAKLGLLDTDVEARHLRMKVGRAEKCWHKNCVAIGLSQGFIEPLEATALQFVHSTIEDFVQAYELGEFTNQYQAQFNSRIEDNFEGIRDYIVLHYKSNSRTDTEYWRLSRENEKISSNLQEIINTWDNLQSIEHTLNRLDIAKYYTATSWNCMLAGIGRFPEQVKRQSNHSNQSEVDLDFVQRFINGCSLNFNDHREELQRA